MSGLKGWTRNNAKDQGSVGYLKYVLATDRDCRFLSEFNDMDIMPNLDGHFYIGRPNGNGDSLHPVASFAVQIKTLPTDYHNSNTRGRRSEYKYSCDTGSFYTVLEKVTLDPVILFLVDYEKLHVFWRYLSINECVNLLKKGDQQTCTVYFNKEDRIDRLADFYDALMAIVETVKCVEGEIVVRNNDSDDFRNSLTASVVELNRLMDNDYRFVKEAFFSNVKQFGFSVNQNKDTLLIKVFRIIENSKGELVRSFEMNDSPGDSSHSFFDLLDPDDVVVFSRKAEGFNPSELVNDFCISQIERLCKKSYLPAKYLSDTILAEAVYYFLDVLAGCYSPLADGECGKPCYKAEEISLEQVIILWEGMRKAEALRYDSLTQGKCRESNEVLLCDPLRRGECLLQKYYGAALNDSVDSFWEVQFSGDFPYKHIESVINELSERNIRKVQRPWHKPEGEIVIEEMRNYGKSPQIYRHYTVDTYYSQLERLITETQDAYRFAMKMLTAEARIKYERAEENAIFLSGSRDPIITIVRTPKAKFETRLSYDSVPVKPTQFGATGFSTEVARVDFMKAPLYSMLEYFFIRAVCETHGIHCVMSFGEHIGTQYK